MRYCSILLILFLAPWPGAAQTPPQPGPLPGEVEEEILALANSPSTLRITGQGRIPTGTSVQGDLVTLGGDFTLGGTVQGRLIVVNGSLRLEEGARVDGATVVIGGEVTGEEEGELTGGLTIYSAPLLYRIRNGQLEGTRGEVRAPSPFLETDLGIGQTRFTLRAAGPYNRVEGLPVQFGPVFTTGGRNPLALEAFGIWRSEGGLSLDTERLGYEFNLSQGLGGRGTLWAGLSSYSRMDGIEDRGMSNLETSLSSFLLRRDYRDFYENQGWSAHLEYRPLQTPIRLRGGFREEEHSFVAPGGPWTLGDQDRDWRPQPAVAGGTAQFVDASFLLDTRDDPDRPSDGWWLQWHGTRQVGGTLHSTVALEAGAHLPGGMRGPTYERVTWSSLDLRRYARVSPTAQLNIRIFGAGTLGSDPLPPQFQSALGGEGSLPGHRRFAIDCGARLGGPIPLMEGGAAEEATTTAMERFPFYGCDRTSLAQLEFRQDLPFNWQPMPDAWAGSEWARPIRIQPSLSIFLNAGQGWVRNEEADARRFDATRRGDAGVGVVAGALGLYWAYPLNQKERGLNFFVRLSHRF